ncbi:MAG: cyclic nucleotide-binding protein [Acidobacteria bacterium]|nr:MAG: cyclic nucleotide-binding protein [Acidobacteriota bacterium]
MARFARTVRMREEASMPARPEMLEGIPFFQTLDGDERAAVAALMKEARFPRGATVFREKDEGGVLYVIRGGKVELSVIGEDGEKVVVDVLEPGEFFGEMSLLDGGGRSTSAVALEDVQTYSLAREEFLGLLRRRADVALDVMAALARRFRKTDELLRRRMPNPNKVVRQRETFGERVADSVAKFGGSWSFIFSFAGVLLSWIAVNAILLRNVGNGPFDPYPFILLNLFLSMLAAIQAPVIMMSQNRQDAKDRIRSELDYQVNLKAELEIMQLHEKFDRLQQELLEREAGRPGR